MTARVTPLKELTVLKHQIPACGLTPNTSIQKKPLLIYKSAFASATAIESHFSKIGVVTAQWRFTMYSFSHFHSTSHEVLAVSNGRAKLCFGHEDNPERVEPLIEKGDVMVVPAGVGHRLLQDLDGGFEMVGTYPNGCNWDMCYGRVGEEGKVKGIEMVKWFDRDPVYGNEGPVLDV